MKFNPLTLIDGYKVGHREQYPEGTEFVFSNFTARSDKLSNVPAEDRDGVVFFGLQYLILDLLIREWNDGFFLRNRDDVVGEYKRRVDGYLGGDIDVSHITELWELGYLPVRIRALKEGTVVPYKVPMLTVENTLPEFFWLTNFIETILSNYLWKPCTSATTALFYRKLFYKNAVETTGDAATVPIQAHDFSMRGMAGPQDAAMSGAAHLTSFIGTDTLPAIDLIEQFYAPVSPAGKAAPIGVSIPATEHSVMCAGGEVNEAETFDRLIFDVYPGGLVSVVSDTWDFWSIITEYLPSRKDRILARDGKVVIRPDSGDPVNIICGDPAAPVGSPEYRGAIEMLYETFGGTVSEQGYIVLADQIGLIYGDSITQQRAKTIMNLLRAKGYATTNVVLGVGSFTYEYVTRDCHGFAMKATYATVNGEGRMLFKDPKTDSGIKKSLRGKFSVYDCPDNGLVVFDGQHTTEGCIMETVFEDGALTRFQGIDEIRQWLIAQLPKSDCQIIKDAA